MKSFIFTLLIIFACACSTFKTIDVSNSFGTKMQNAFEGYYTIEQFDSICIADTINPNIKEWQKLSIRDYESGEDASQYFYIKSLGEHENIYRVFYVNDSILKITKRVTK